MYSPGYIDQPVEVSLETYSFCNAACTFCPYTTMERIGEKMSDELIERLVVEMESFELPFFFSPFKVNEPLLDKRTIPLCEDMIKRTKATIRFFTNGSALTPKNIEGIAGLERVCHLWISLNDHRADEYRKLMGLDFNKVAKNLDYLHKQSFPHDVMLSTVGYPNEDFRRYCFDRWPRFGSIAISRADWLGQIDSENDTIRDIPCSRWWELSIMANGIASLCCMDSEGRFSVGDLNKSTLLEVYSATREWRLGKPKSEIHPCDTCTYPLPD